MYFGGVALNVLKETYCITYLDTENPSYITWSTCGGLINLQQLPCHSVGGKVSVEEEGEGKDALLPLHPAAPSFNSGYWCYMLQ